MRRPGIQWTGILLFLFIPAVLYLLVSHPPPLGLSLAAGLILMVAHRWLARPYMERARLRKCLWCNRLVESTPTAAAPAVVTLEIRSGGRGGTAVCCSTHAVATERFFAFLQHWRWALRAGIFIPLLLLILALAAATWVPGVPLENATAFFRLAIGISVNLAAQGYFLVAPRRPLQVPFPVHNFFLLGVRPLLWIFRLVGCWWIYLGLAHFLAG